MHLLFVIPARGGSKGIPGKNIKALNGKPLIHYSIEYARQFAADEFICVSTDSDEIAACAGEMQLAIPFKRPAELATDTAGSWEVLKHALSFYDGLGKKIDAVVLLQPTSPIRKEYHLKEALALYNSSIDMVVGVQPAASNPYFSLFEENKAGYLHISKGDGSIATRQEAPAVYEYNGALYIINPNSLRAKKSFRFLDKIIKYGMEGKYGIDLDTMEDWEYLEYLLQRNK